MAKPFLALAVAATLTSGCEYWRVVNFSEEPLSFKTDQKHVSLITYRHGNEPLAGLESGYPEDFQAILQQCGPDEIETVAPLAPIVIFAVSQVIGFVASELASAAEELKKKSVRSYSAEQIIENTSILDDGTCLILVRSEELARSQSLPGFESVGMIMVLRISTRGSYKSGFILEEIYFLPQNSTALTGKGKGVDFTVTFGASSVAKRSNKFVHETFAADSLKFADVPLGMRLEAPGLMKKTSMMSMPPLDADVVEVTVSVLEAGNAIPDSEKAAAEIKEFQKVINGVAEKQLSSILGQ